MKIKFNGVPGEPAIDEISMYDYTFKKGDFVSVKDASLLVKRKLAAHPHFSADPDLKDYLKATEPKAVL